MFTENEGGEQSSTDTTEATSTPAEGEASGTIDITGGQPAAGEETSTQGESGEAQTKASEDAGEATGFEPFNLPDGVTVAEEDLAVFTELGQKFGLDQEGAQGMIDLSLKVQEQAIAETRAAIEAEAETEKQGWRDALHADKELGGANLEATQQLVTAFESTGLASDGLIDALNDKGLLQHPEMVRMMTTIGRMVSENPVNLGGGETADDGMTPAQRMYRTSGHE